MITGIYKFGGLVIPAAVGIIDAYNVMGYDLNTLVVASIPIYANIEAKEQGFAPIVVANIEFRGMVAKEIYEAPNNHEYIYQEVVKGDSEERKWCDVFLGWSIV